MIVEHRMYTLHVGKVAEYIKIYESEGLAIQSRILGAPVGWYYTEIGTINRIIHMWMYEDLNDRRDRRAKMAADPGWQAYLQKIQPLIITQESMILNPAPFFTPKR